MSVSFLTNLSEQEFKEFLKDALREIMGNPVSAKEPFPQILNAKQAAAFVKLEITTLYEKTSRKLIPHFKKGNKLYFHLSELQDWIRQGKVRTQEEIERDAITYTLTGGNKPEEK
jgi:hypothetical protein